MKLLKLSVIVFAAAAVWGCSNPPAKNETGNPGREAEVDLSRTARPQGIVELMKARGDQDKAMPELIVESPKNGEVITGSTVRVKVRVTGDLKGLKMGKDESGKGNHVHVILDNQPYAAHYNWNEGFELRNVKDGKHVLRMFPSRPWHESFKNEKAFKSVTFTVKNGNADEAKPTTDHKGKKLGEGTDVKESTAGDVDLGKPLLTYSRPKGTYKGKDANAIMIDFWLTNAKLVGDGGEYRVRYSFGGRQIGFIDKWGPIWLTGWRDGKNSVTLELVDRDGKLVPNGGYNSTKREFTVSP